MMKDGAKLMKEDGRRRRTVGSWIRQMTVELGGFWRKPMDVEEHFFEEVSRRRRAFGCARELGRSE